MLAGVGVKPGIDDDASYGECTQLVSQANDQRRTAEAWVAVRIDEDPLRPPRYDRADDPGLHEEEGESVVHVRGTGILTERKPGEGDGSAHVKLAIRTQRVAWRYTLKGAKTATSTSASPKPTTVVGHFNPVALMAHRHLARGRDVGDDMTRGDDVLPLGMINRGGWSCPALMDTYPLGSGNVDRAVLYYSIPALICATSNTPVRLPKMGAGETTCERPSSDASAHHQARSQRCEARTCAVCHERGECPDRSG